MLMTSYPITSLMLTLFLVITHTSAQKLRLTSSQDREVYVHSRDDLPAFPLDTMARIYYAEAPLAFAPKLAKFFRQFHSAMTVYLDDGREMTFGFEAKDGMNGALLPTNLSGVVPIWDSDAVCTYENYITHTYWEHETLIANASGTVLNKYMQFIVNFAKSHPNYQLWEVWTQSHLPPPEERLFNSTICSTFTEAAIWALQGFGATMNIAAMPNRNYGAFIARQPPVLVNMSDPQELAEVMSFYKTVKAVIGDIRSLSILDFMKLMLQVLRDMLRDAHVFIYDPVNGGYFKVHLKPPLVTATGVYGPMHVPWLKSQLAESGNSTSAHILV